MRMLHSGLLFDWSIDFIGTRSLYPHLPIRSRALSMVQSLRANQICAVADVHEHWFVRHARTRLARTGWGDD